MGTPPQFTLYLSTMLKPIAHCNLRKQIGHRSRGRRSASSKWLEPCIRHASHWQCRSPNMCPISWVKVCKTFTPRLYRAIINSKLHTPAFPYFSKKQICRNQLPYHHPQNFNLPEDLTPHFLKCLPAFLTSLNHLITGPGFLNFDTTDTLGGNILGEGGYPVP